jgi:hypothetical protein
MITGFWVQGASSAIVWQWVSFNRKHALGPKDRESDVAYADVAQVKKQGGGLSPLTWGIIGSAAVAAIIVE